MFKLLNTIIHLKPIQALYQVKVRLGTPQLKVYTKKGYALKYKSFIKKMKSNFGNEFEFLNIRKPFSNWSDLSNGSLWTYNLNYMDWLLQKDISYEEGVSWVNKFIDGLPDNEVGLDPYPIALRSINWIKFICYYSDRLSRAQLEKWNNSLYSQYKLLIRKLEYHLLGNHLLENAYSLFIASLYFQDRAFYKTAKRLLVKELGEQILSDGAHFEQSPMYHCILLDRLLDCYNLSINNIIFHNQENINIFLRDKATSMLGHLESILYDDGTYPLFNDSAEKVAPTPQDIFLYAQNLNLQWKIRSLKECGYRKFQNSNMEAFIDIGNITASYQPGHTHSDVFNYELRVDGMPFIVDTGVSTYEKTERRQYERGSSAHNTITINELDAYEVWAGFRVGQRASVEIIEDKYNHITAFHDGYKRYGNCIVEREFLMDKEQFIICDKTSLPTDSISHIHFAPNVQVLEISKNVIETNLAVINIIGADSLVLMDNKVSKEYNKLEQSKKIKVFFTSEMKYIIKRKNNNEDYYC